MPWPGHICALDSTYVSAAAYMSWPGHICPGQDIYALARTYTSWPGHVCPDQDRSDRDRKIFSFQRQKVKCRGSPETRFGQVSGQSEPSSGGKWMFKVCENIEKNSSSRRRKIKCRESSETRFGQVSSRSEPSSGFKRPFKVSEKFRNRLRQSCQGRLRNFV